jgi:hypothetical protein
VNDSEVEIHKTLAMRSDNSFDSVEFCNLIGPDLRAAVRGQGEVSVPRDATTTGAIRELRLLLAVHRTKSQQIRLELI